MSHEAEALPIRLCLGVYVALISLTALTVGAAFLDMSFLNTPVALGIASVKALLVMYFFMELRHSSKLTWVMMGSSGVFLTIMIMLTMSDAISRGWLGVPGK
ncbi:MAG: cytochrome C oxidase subunit IV family protein [bacterium]